MMPCISSAGMVTSLGPDVQTVFAALCAGRSGLKPLQGFDATHYHVRAAYEIADRKRAGVDEPMRSTRWLCEAIRQAVREARLDARKTRLAVIVGTGLRELRSLELWHADRELFRIDHLHFGAAVRQCLAAEVPVYTLANACAASNFALGLGADLLALGEADAVIAAGCDSITESMFGLLDRAHATKPESVRPFDTERRGVIMGEGAAAVVLESEHTARARGVKPLALVRGVGMSCDAVHETAPAQSGIVEAIHDAHRRAGVQPAEIDLIMAHGTGTVLNDRTEALALAEIFAGLRRKPLVTAIKSMTGHTSGASGLVGVVTATQIMAHHIVPPTIGLCTPIPEIAALPLVGPSAQAAEVRLGQVNAFGFGGVNAVVILERMKS